MSELVSTNVTSKPVSDTSVVLQNGALSFLTLNIETSMYFTGKTLKM